ncbi:MAG: acyltransferase family protein [Roseimicrobium sp.]
MSAARSSPGYMPQLDGLRAIAVLLVLIHHWVPEFTAYGRWGFLGVRCFFVLSGFLITGILLDSRRLVEAGVTSNAFQFRQFYIRRSLRIFPIYYLMLLVGCLVGMAGLKATWGWHAAYLTNFYITSVNDWEGNYCHLWSLAVEEQFYLIWPAVMLLVPRQWLRALFYAIIAAAVLSRVGVVLYFGEGHLAAQVLTPCCLDSLVFGALAALVSRTQPNGIAAACAAPWRAVGLIGAVLAAAGHVLRVQGLYTGALDVLEPLVQSMFFVWLVAVTARGATGWVGRLLEAPPLRYLGRISYGLYLYHMFVPYMTAIVFGKLGWEEPVGTWPNFALHFTISLLVAALSERLLEAPFNRLKRFFPALPAQRISPAPAHSAGAMLRPAPTASFQG